MAERARKRLQVDRAQERRELEVARKREGILHAAARAFARGGYHATTMQDIAREAGYTPPSLYAYFAGKEQIYLELAVLLSREFVAVFQQPVSETLPFPERLELLLRGLFEKADRHRDAVTVFLMARLSGGTSFSQGMAARTLEAPETLESDDFSSVQLLTDWLTRNATKRELGERRPEYMGIALAGLAHAFCIQWLANGSRTSAASLASQVASLFLFGAVGVAAEAPIRAAVVGAHQDDKHRGGLRKSESRASRLRGR